MSKDEMQLWASLAGAVLRTSEDHAWMARGFVALLDREINESSVRSQLDSMRDKITARRDDVPPEFIADFDSLVSKYVELAREHAKTVTALKLEAVDSIARAERHHEIIGDALEKLKRSLA